MSVDDVLAASRARAQRALEDQAKRNPDCVTCQRLLRDGDVYSPSHAASARCRSGGRAHCTCDTCF